MEDGETIRPLSFGFVTEDGDGLYVIVDDADRSLANPWVVENVLPHIDKYPITASCRFKHAEIGPLVRRWIDKFAPDPEFWADYCSYDWVVLCQLFGMMVDLPDGWPMFCNDIQQEALRLGVNDLPQGEDDHNAYRDALTT